MRVLLQARKHDLHRIQDMVKLWKKSVNLKLFTVNKTISERITVLVDGKILRKWNCFRVFYRRELRTFNPWNWAKHRPLFPHTIVTAHRPPFWNEQIKWSSRIKLHFLSGSSLLVTLGGSNVKFGKQHGARLPTKRSMMAFFLKERTYALLNNEN